MRGGLASFLFVVLCGAVAGLQLAWCMPAPFRDGIVGLQRQPYRLVRNEATALTIDDANWLSVPHLYGDFDLSMDLELGERTDLDVVLRLVQPRQLGAEFPQFDARFTVLRLSTVAPGPAWRSRDQALFEPRGSGAELAPGVVATVWVEARGGWLRANVAGRWLPWQRAADEYGALALLTHGGKAAVKTLSILPRAELAPWRRAVAFWAGLGAVAGALLALLAGGSLARGVAGAAFLGLASAGAVAVPVAALGLPQLDHQLWGLGLAWLLAATLTDQLGPRLLWAGLAVVVGVAGVPSAPVADPRLWATFGPQSGIAPCEALAQRVRGPFEVHGVVPSTARVFLLGGAQLYDRGAPTEHLEPLLAGELRGRLQRKVDVPCLPTVDGYTAQQWRLFTGFFQAYAPQALVFGVPLAEAAPGPDGRPRSSPAALAGTLTAVRAHCVRQGCALVLFTERELPTELLAVLQDAERAGVPLLVAEPGESPIAIAQRLGAVLAAKLEAPR